MEETRARMPTISFPITVITARIADNLLIDFYDPSLRNAPVHKIARIIQIPVLIMNGKKSSVKKGGLSFLRGAYECRKGAKGVHPWMESGAKQIETLNRISGKTA